MKEVTVKDLIEDLLKMEDDAVVFIDTDEGMTPMTEAVLLPKGRIMTICLIRG